MLSKEQTTIISVVIASLTVSLLILCVIGTFYFGINNNGVGFWFSAIGAIIIAVFMFVVKCADNDGMFDKK